LPEKNLSLHLLARDKKLHGPRTYFFLNTTNFEKVSLKKDLISKGIK
jgi:hypothetical protein